MQPKKPVRPKTPRRTRNSTSFDYNILFFDEINNPITVFPLKLKQNTVEKVKFNSLQDELARDIERYHTCTVHSGSLRFWIVSRLFHLFYIVAHLVYVASKPITDG